MGTVKVCDGIVGRRLREAACIAGTTQGEVLGCLVVLWQWAIDNADENGVVNHASKRDVARCISVVSDDLFAEIAEALFQTGFIREQEDGLVFDEWGDHQAWHYKEESARKRDAQRKRAERMKAKSVQPEPVKTPEPPPKPEEEAAPKEQKKKKPSKKHYAEFVLMTKDEYGKLCEQYGEPLVLKGIEILNQYIGSSGRSYKSHYMTMIGWPIKEAIKKNPHLFAEYKASKASAGADENPYAEYME